MRRSIPEGPLVAVHHPAMVIGRKPLGGDWRAFEEYYQRDTLWPPESLARHQALLPLIKAYRASLRSDA